MIRHPEDERIWTFDGLRAIDTFERLRVTQLVDGQATVQASFPALRPDAWCGEYKLNLDA